jgi:hypothetical protein
VKNGIEDTKIVSEMHDYVGAAEVPKFVSRERYRSRRDSISSSEGQRLKVNRGREIPQRNLMRFVDMYPS